MVWHHGPYDQPLLLFRELYIERLLPSVAAAPHAATIIDIGANIGAATLYWAAERPDLVFQCYEPNPQAFTSLETNMAVNCLKNAHLYSEAVGREAGCVSLWIDVPTALSSAYGDPPGPGGKKVDAPLIAIEDVLERAADTIWMLKVDTEGSEGEIFDGASPSSLRRCNHIVVEWHDNIVPGVSQLVRTRLAQAGFAIQSERRHPWNEGIYYARRAHR